MARGWRIAGLLLAVAMVTMALPAVITSQGEAALAASSTQVTTVRDGSFLAPPDGLTPFRGDMHAHTHHSDGEDDPGVALDEAKAAGYLDFFALTDHSEWFLFPFKADEDCISPDALECYASPAPGEATTEWHKQAEEADRVTDDGFVALRGFEWSSPIEGHINVYETTVWTDTVQTGPAPMAPFYGWLVGQQHDPDRYATFNHPGREELTFDGFAYHEAVDPLMTSIEAFNRDDAYTDQVLAALDEGWHLGVHGVSDGHSTDARLDPLAGHTVALMPELSREGIREAFLAHRTIGTQGTDLDARFTVDGHPMGSTLEAPSQTVSAHVKLLDAGTTGATDFTGLTLLGPQGFRQAIPIEPGPTVAATVTVDLSEVPTTEAGERYLVAVAEQTFQGQTDRPVIMTSPIWLR